MCGRFLFDAEFDEVYQKFMLFERDFNFPKGAINPTNQAATIVSEQGNPKLKLMKWGLEGFDKGQQLINARSETLLQKPRFSKLMSNRCVIPATSFFEWEKRGSEKIPHQFKLSNVMSLAGLYEPIPGGAAFTILTMASSGDVAPYHGRMPVSLSDEALSSWLYGSVPEAYETMLSQTPHYELMDAVVQLTFL